jgi:hypothetical protein
MKRNSYVLMCSPAVGKIITTLNSKIAKKDSINNYSLKNFTFGFSSTLQVNIQIGQNIFCGIILTIPTTLGVFRKTGYLFEKENHCKIFFFLFKNTKTFKKSFQWFKTFIFKPLIQENFKILTENSFSYLFDRKKKFDFFKK